MEGVIGFTTMFAGNFAPKNWAFCQGQIINIASNTALFSILGTTYGGNGTTTFALPNLIGRQVVSTGTGPGLSSYTLGEVTGTPNVTLNITNLPAHVHPISYTVQLNASSDVNTSTATNAYYASDNATGATPYTSPDTTKLAPYNGSLTTSSNGSNQPISNQNPVMALNYIICLYGVYPARN